MSSQTVDRAKSEPTDPMVSSAGEACAPNACAADPLALLGALTLGIGVGAVSGAILQPMAIWLVVAGCLVHGWGMVRGRLIGPSPSRRGGRWVTMIDVASWIAIAAAAVAVALAAGRAA